MKNLSRTYRIHQDHDAKFSAGDVTVATVAKFALSPSGNKTYIIDDATAPPNPKTRRKKRKATPPWGPYKV